MFVCILSLQFAQFNEYICQHLNLSHLSALHLTSSAKHQQAINRINLMHSKLLSCCSQYAMQGEANRMVAEHQLNRESSRSHTIFSIMLERSTGAEGDEVITSKLNLVDLAGSERISKTKSEGTVLKEAQQINKSLSFLEQVGMK